MKRLIGNLKKILKGSKPSPPEIKSRPQPTNIPNWMQQDSQPLSHNPKEAEQISVRHHHNPNVRTLELKADLPSCRGNQHGTKPEKHPLSALLKINGLQSFYCSQKTLSVVKDQHAEWSSILPQISSSLQNIRQNIRH